MATIKKVILNTSKHIFQGPILEIKSFQYSAACYILSLTKLKISAHPYKISEARVSEQSEVGKAIVLLEEVSINLSYILQSSNSLNLKALSLARETCLMTTTCR